MNETRLPLKTKLGYGVCDLGGNLFFTVIGFWLLNYLTDTVGLLAGLAGAVVAIGKVWDAVTDPLVGFWSDRTRLRWGRRRPFMLFGALPLWAAMFLLFTNPRLGSQTALFIWGVICFCLLCFTYTLVNIPYNALSVELTQDFHERTSLNGYRFGFATVGTLLGAGAALPLVTMLPNRDQGFSAMGAIFGGIMFVTALITVFTVRETRAGEPEPNMGFFKTYGHVFRNRPYLLVFTMYGVFLTGLTVLMGVAVYYFKYIQHNEGRTTVAMLIMLVTAMAFIPISVVASRRLGKKSVLAAGILVLIVGCLSLYALGHRLPPSFSLGTMVFWGAGLGATMALPYSMAADAVEYDYLITGMRREGAFFGMWTFGAKVGQALALAVSGLVLSVAGYAPEVEQSASAALGIRLLLGPIPVVFFLGALVLLYYYPINQKRYEEILAGIREMEARDSFRRRPS